MTSAVMSAAARRAFVRRHTRVRPVPGVDRIRLHLADELTPIWEMTEEELGASGVDPPFWAFAWSGGQAVARYLLEHPDEVAGRTVLDFAAGSGLAAIAAHLAGAAAALAADIDMFATTAVGLNAEVNDAGVSVTNANLLDGEPPDVDLVLAGDVCYEHAMATAVLPWLRAAAAAGSTVLLGDPGRRYLPTQGVQPLARYVVPTSPEVEEGEWRASTVYRLLP